MNGPQLTVPTVQEKGLACEELIMWIKKYERNKIWNQIRMNLKYHRGRCSKNLVLCAAYCHILLPVDHSNQQLVQDEVEDATQPTRGNYGGDKDDGSAKYENLQNKWICICHKFHIAKQVPLHVMGVYHLRGLTALEAPLSTQFDD